MTGADPVGAGSCYARGRIAEEGGGKGMFLISAWLDPRGDEHLLTEDIYDPGLSRDQR